MTKIVMLNKTSEAIGFDLTCAVGNITDTEMAKGSILKENDLLGICVGPKAFMTNPPVGVKTRSEKIVLNGLVLIVINGLPLSHLVRASDIVGYLTSIGETRIKFNPYGTILDGGEIPAFVYELESIREYTPGVDSQNQLDIEIYQTSKSNLRTLVDENTDPDVSSFEKGDVGTSMRTSLSFLPNVKELMTAGPIDFQNSIELGTGSKPMTADIEQFKDDVLTLNNVLVSEIKNM